MILSKKSLSAALLLCLAAISSARAEKSYDVSPLDAGGVEIWLSTLAEGKARHPFIQIAGRNSLRDVKYAILKEDTQNYSIIEEGSLGTLRNGEFKNLPGKKVRLDEISRFQVCLSFTNAQTKQNHILVSFFSENAGVAAGNITQAFATEHAAPIRLKTDGTMTCTDALADEFTRGLDHADRFRTAAEIATPDPEADELREGLFHVMTFFAYGKFSYNVEMYTLRSIADAEFKVALTSKDGTGNREVVGSRLGYLAPSYVLEPRKMMGIEEWPDRVPGKVVEISSCAAYFDVAEQRYAKETWTAEASLKQQMETPHPDDGVYHYPEKINWEFSQDPLRC